MFIIIIIPKPDLMNMKISDKTYKEERVKVIVGIEEKT